MCGSCWAIRYITSLVQVFWFMCEYVVCECVHTYVCFLWVCVSMIVCVLVSVWMLECDCVYLNIWCAFDQTFSLPPPSPPSSHPPFLASLPPSSPTTPSSKDYLNSGLDIRQCVSIVCLYSRICTKSFNFSANFGKFNNKYNTLNFSYLHCYSDIIFHTVSYGFCAHMSYNSKFLAHGRFFRSMRASLKMRQEVFFVVVPPPAPPWDGLGQ